jgi:hypothetical protein
MDIIRFPLPADPDGLGALSAIDWRFEIPEGARISAVAERRYRLGSNPLPGYVDPHDPGVVVCLMLIDRSRNVAYLPCPSATTVPAASGREAGTGRPGEGTGPRWRRRKPEIGHDRAKSVDPSSALEPSRPPA